MSFTLTTEQYRNGSKTVTRRLGWRRLHAGDRFMGVEKGMGLKKGEKVKLLHPSRVVRVSTEALKAITQEDCVKEGFPHLSPAQFVALFCAANKCTPDTLVRRIEFAHQIG